MAKKTLAKPYTPTEEFEEIQWPKPVSYVLATALQLPQGTKWLQRINGQWIVHNDYLREFLEWQPSAILHAIVGY